jgi:hypothetical protein
MAWSHSCSHCSIDVNSRRLLAGLVVIVGCTRDAPRSVPTVADSSAQTVDSLGDERPDSTASQRATPRTAPLVLLPAPRGASLSGLAAALAERAVFVPRNERWFVARALDGAWRMDIGRLDGGLRDEDAQREAFAAMTAARSPIVVGMPFVMHDARGARVATITGIETSGRRIVARLDLLVDSAQTPAPAILEWRGAAAAGAAVDSLTRTRVACVPTPPAVSATLARLAPPRATSVDSAAPRAPTVTTRTSGISGCFGRWHGIIVTRPTNTSEIDASPETVRLVRADGSLAPGRLRDLSYPHHDILATLDVDADGTSELLVRSYRPAMDTYAVLRMSDSVSFTRLARGFTVERR